MDEFLSPISIGTLVVIACLYVISANRNALGALSLPCFTYLTSFVYFYLMPFIFLSSGYTDWFGLALVDLEKIHLATFLYVAGAAAAFWHGGDHLRKDPAEPRPGIDREPNMELFYGLLFAALLGIAARVYLGQLGFAETAELESAATGQAFGFLNLSYSILIGLVIFTLVRDRFGYKSLFFLGVVLGIFVLDGFRFRIVILLSAAVIAFAVIQRIKIRTAYVFGGSILAIAVLNAFGMTRTYGRGLDLAGIEGLSWGELFQSFGGEVGPVFVLQHITDAPPALIYFEPWANVAARFIPSFLWPDKPVPEYLLLYVVPFPDPRALQAGIAGTQHSEFLLQFGWVGLPILAFLFFRLAVYLVGLIQKLPLEVRVAGCAIVPALFGFYAQQRGYAFQVVSEALFTLGPLFLLSIRSPSSRRSQVVEGPSREAAA